MQYKVENKVVIWANDNYNVLGMLRQLVPYGIDVFVLFNETTKFCAVKSKYCKQYHVAKSMQDGLTFLLTSFQNENHKAILLTSSDLLAEAIDLHREELSKYFYLTGTSESGLLTKVIDKNYMSVLAGKHGFTLPFSMECKKGTDISNVKYPCLLKPNKHVIGVPAYFKFRVFKNQQELIGFLQGIAENAVFTLQEYIPKEKDLLVYGARLYDGSILLPGAYIKDRWAPGDGTHGYLTDTIPDSACVDSIKSFLEEIDFYGTFSFEYGLYNDKAYFFECNLRNDGTSNHFHQAGANVVLAFVLSIAGQDYTKVCNKVRPLTYFIDEIADRNNVKAGIITKQEYKRQLKESGAFMYYDEADVVPYRYMLIKYYLMPIYNFIKRLKNESN